MRGMSVYRMAMQRDQDDWKIAQVKKQIAGSYGMKPSEARRLLREAGCFEIEIDDWLALERVG